MPGRDVTDLFMQSRIPQESTKQETLPSEPAPGGGGPLPVFDPLGLVEWWSDGKARDPVRSWFLRLFYERKR